MQRVVEVEGAVFDAKLVCIQFGDVQNIVNDANQGITGRAHPLQRVMLLQGQFIMIQQLGKTQDRIHRRSDFMAHVGQKLNLGRAGHGQFSGPFFNLLFEVQVQLSDSLLLSLALANIANHQGVAACRDLHGKN